LKAFVYLLLALFFAVMLFVASLLRPRGDATSPMNRRETVAGTAVAGAYYIARANHDAATANIVTVVLADYRGFDTLGETIVVFTAGIACLLILRRRP